VDASVLAGRRQRDVSLARRVHAIEAVRLDGALGGQPLHLDLGDQEVRAPGAEPDAVGADREDQRDQGHADPHEVAPAGRLQEQVVQHPGQQHVGDQQPAQEPDRRRRRGRDVVQDAGQLVVAVAVAGRPFAGRGSETAAAARAGRSESAGRHRPVPALDSAQGAADGVGPGHAGQLGLGVEGLREGVEGELHHPPRAVRALDHQRLSIIGEQHDPAAADLTAGDLGRRVRGASGQRREGSQ
jgi:hypothetical protein